MTIKDKSELKQKQGDRSIGNIAKTMKKSREAWRLKMLERLVAT